MEARVPYSFITLAVCAFVLLLPETLQAASYRTANFVVHAASEEFARRVGDEAERFRRELAIMWAGQVLPNWSAPCPIQVKVGQIGAGGATTFSFHNGEVFGWNMNIQGTEERILDSVLPHEITHTILACRFRRPLPRWADEGISTLVEHESERRRQVRLLGDVMRGGTKIPLRSLLAMTEYPPDMRDVMKLYAQGYSLTDYLVQQGGRETFLKFLTDALRHGGWDQALSAHYGLNSIDNLEKKWDSWVLAGSPELNPEQNESLASNQAAQKGSLEDSVVRAQSPDQPAAADPRLSQATRNNGSSAPLFTGGTGKQTASAPTRSGSATQHQAARSRQELMQPVYSTELSRSAHRSEQRSRDHLEMTREQFISPATPLSTRDQVHPFAGGPQNDPFAN